MIQHAPVRPSKYVPGEFTREEIMVLSDYVATHDLDGNTVRTQRDSKGLLWLMRANGTLYQLSAATQEP